MSSLFEDEPEQPRKPKVVSAHAPLAEKLRPRTWDDFQAGDSFDATLLKQLKAGAGRPPSLVLWGPPGTGKTTLAKLIGASFAMPFVEFSAVLGGVQEVRAIVAEAQKRSSPTLLFVDEIHRFNKAQQDAFLPHVEAGTIVLVGATTENPSFALNGALLSRLRVVVFPPLSKEGLSTLVNRAETILGITFEPEAKAKLVHLAGGDARRLLNWCEAFHDARGPQKKPATVTEVDHYLKNAQAPLYDKSGEQHYDTISAFIKSLRGSDADAALFYGLRMIESGEDPRFVIRRMMIFASEDCSCDPRALDIAVAVDRAVERVGLPEGKIPLAQAAVYLSCCAKSNATYTAMNRMQAVIDANPELEIPKRLRNAPTELMKQQGNHKGYKYPHDYPGGFVPERYLPEALGDLVVYEPTDRALDAQIRDRLNHYRELIRKK